MVSILPEDAIAHSLEKAVLDSCDVKMEHADQGSVHIKEAAELHHVELVEHFSIEPVQIVKSCRISERSLHQMG